MNTQRIIEREGYTWILDTADVVGQTPYSKQTVLRRGKEVWATVKLKNDGKTLKLIQVLPSCVVPVSVMTEIRKELGIG